MLRLFVLASVALTLSLGACGSSEKKKTDTPTETAPTVTTRPDSEAIVGTWQAGTTTIKFTADGKYTWNETRACGAPPCPTTSSNGTYQFRNGKLYLNAAGADTNEAVEFQWAPGQDGLMLNSNKQGKSWNLMRGM